MLLLTEAHRIIVRNHELKLGDVVVRHRILIGSQQADIDLRVYARLVRIRLC